MTQTALFLLKILQCSTMAHSASRSYTSAHNKINARASPARARLNLPLRTSARAPLLLFTRECERQDSARCRFAFHAISALLLLCVTCCATDSIRCCTAAAADDRPNFLLDVVAAVHLMSECSRCVETRRRIKIKKCSWTTKVNRKSVPRLTLSSV